ncbi:MAG: hypothetical protein NC395_04060 [Prevotella sp.]|nr:hypothetical protein [Prevotella sp.]
MLKSIEDDRGDGVPAFCTVELDDGLGTVKCSYAVWYPDTQKIEIGERIHIYANGDIYGDPPRIDAEFIASESEAEDLGNAE